MPATPPTRPACLPSHRPPGRSLVTRVVIVGGGPAGLAAYRAILRACGSAVRSGELHLSVISGTPDFRAPGLNADVLAGHLTAESARTPLRRLMPRATVLMGRVAQADLTMQRLQVSRADHSPCWLGFDHLILSEARPDADTGPLAARLDTHRPAHVAVLDGNGAGVEPALAACERQRQRDPERGPGRVTLLCSGELSGGRPGVGSPVRAALAAAGVAAHELTRAVHTASGGVRDQYGRLHPSDLTVTADAAPPVLPGTESLPRDGRGFLLTDATLRVPDPANVWAARTPAQGAHAGRNVARALRRREAQPVPDGQWTAHSVRLGHWNAVTCLRLLPTPTGGGGRSLILRGRLGWLARTLLLSAALPRPAERLRVALALLRPAPRAGRDVPAAPRAAADRPTPV